MRKLCLSLIAMFGLLILTSTVMATPILTGTANYVGGSSWTASVYYEVYAPGNNGSPIGATTTDYVYTYDITNNASSSVPLSQFTVGNPWQLYISGAGCVGGVAPYLILIGTSSTQYTYSPNLPAGSSSYVYLTSPYVPGWVSGGLIDGGITNNQSVPGPAVPEPASLFLLGGSILGLAAFMRKRNKR